MFETQKEKEDFHLNFFFAKMGNSLYLQNGTLHKTESLFWILIQLSRHAHTPDFKTNTRTRESKSKQNKIHHFFFSFFRLKTVSMTMC